MAVTERTRHELHEALVELMGPAKAETMMESLPPVGWGDIATKHDLDQLEKRFDLRMDAVEERFDLRMEALEHRLGATWDAKLRQNTLTMYGFMLSQTAILMTLILATR